MRTSKALRVWNNLRTLEPSQARSLPKKQDLSTGKTRIRRPTSPSQQWGTSGEAFKGLQVCTAVRGRKTVRALFANWHVMKATFPSA